MPRSSARMKMMFGLRLAVCAPNVAQARALRNSLLRIFAPRAMLSWRHVFQAVGARGAGVSKIVPAAADGKSGGGALPGLRIRELARSRRGSDREAREQAGPGMRVPGGQSRRQSERNGPVRPGRSRWFSGRNQSFRRSRQTLPVDAPGHAHGQRTARRSARGAAREHRRRPQSAAATSWRRTASP